MAPETATGVTDLTSFLAHDMRASLRFAQLNLTNLEAAVESGNEDSLHRYIAALRARLEGADNILARLREYGQALHPASMAETVEFSSLVVELERLAAACNFTCHTTGPSVNLNTSRRHLRLVLRELVDNAINHHDRGEGRLEITWHVRKEYLFVAIGDDGPGIPPEFHRRILDLGRTLHAKDTRRNAGVGLSIVNAVLARLGRRLGIRSDPAARRGTLVYFRWPLALPDPLIDHGDADED